MSPDRETTMGGAGRTPSATKWSVLLGMKDRSSGAFRAGMEQLALQYWKPVYRTIRWSWGRPNEEAKDLTQEFFAELMLSDVWSTIGPEKGRFRTLLKLLLKRFMQDRAKYVSRIKRGGSAKIVSLDALIQEEGDVGPPVREEPHEKVFDQEWARMVLREAYQAAEVRLGEAGEQRALDLFRRKYLPLQQEGAPVTPEPTYEDLARETGLSRSDVNNLLSRARKEFRAALDDIIRGYVGSEDEVAAERQHLLGTL